MHGIEYMRVEVYDRWLFHQHQQYDLLAGLYYLFQQTDYEAHEDSRAKIIGVVVNDLLDNMDSNGFAFRLYEQGSQCDFKVGAVMISEPGIKAHAVIYGIQWNVFTVPVPLQLDGGNNPNVHIIDILIDEHDHEAE